MTHYPASSSLAAAPPNDFAQTLLEVSLTGFIVFRPVYAAAATVIQDFAYEYLNPVAQQLLRLPECPAESLLTLYPAARPTGIFAFYCAVFASGQTERYQVNYQHDGLDGYFHLVARRSGEQLVVSFTDTNDQPRTGVEEALRQSQAREQAAYAAAERQRQQLQALVDQSPVAIGYFEGPELRVTAANPLLSAMWGRQQTQVLGRPLLEGVPELAGQGFGELMVQVRETGVPFVGTEVPAQLLRDGQLATTYYNFVYQPLYDAQGTAVGVIDVAVEVTEQVRARQQVEEKERQTNHLNQELQAANEAIQATNDTLIRTQQQLRQLNEELEARVQARTHDAQTAQTQAQAQRQRLERLFSQAPAAICILSGPALVYELVNPTYQQFFPERRLLGKPLLDALPELTDHAAYHTMRQVFDTGEAVWQQALHTPLARRQDGVLEDRYFNYVQQPRYDDQGRIDGVIVFGFEVTELVQARQQVEQLNQALAAINEELQATNEELGDSNTQLTRTNVELDNFIYTASHDLKAPISNIEGLLLALGHELPAAGRVGDVPAMLAMMQGAVERFQQTLLHLTEVSKLQKELGQVSEPVALAAVVEAVRLDLRPLLVQTQAQLDVQIPPSLTVHFSEKNLRSVVYNLLSNALKYHHPDRVPQVRLRYELQRDYQVLAVQDNGLGLDLTQGQDKLFAMFQRLHTHVEGTGLGLYMVKKIVENAGGRVEVQSQLGQGTTFRVYMRR